MINHPPGFCKIIFDSVSDISIRIPPMFTRRYGLRLPDTVYLKVPNASLLWEVNVTSDDDGELWLANGWKEFTKHYSIDFGHYLVFQYDCESMQFDVMVFDLTSTEIIYPLESVEGISKTRKGKEKIVEYGNEEPKMRRTSKKDDRVEISVRRSTRNVRFGGNCTENNEKEDSFTQEGGSHISTNEGFTKLLSPAATYRLILPKRFAEDTGIAAKGQVMLQNAKGTQWQALVRVYKRENRIRYFLTSGWNKFLTDNMVTVGTTMSFNLISSSDNIVEARVIKFGSNEKEIFKHVKRRKGRFSSNVPYETSDHVERVPESIQTESENDDYTTSDSHTETTEEDSFTDQEGGSRVQKVWTFTKKLIACNAYRLFLPREFTEGTGISAHREIMVQNVNGRTWPVHVVDKKSGRYEIGGGWNKFLIDNKVIIDSTMSFEFLNSSSKYKIEAQVVKMGANKNKLFKDVKRINGSGYRYTPR